MEEAIKKKLCEAGVDMEKTMARFMNNEGFYQKFLLKFPGDHNFDALETALKEKDWEGVERAAHTLKGVAANLGLDPLADVFNDIVWAVRQDQPEKLDALSLKMQEQRDIFFHIIGQFK